MVGKSSRPTLVGFCSFKPAADHFANLDARFGKFCEPSVVEAARRVREPQMREQYLQLDIGLVEYQESRWPSFALCVIERFHQIKDGSFYSRPQRVPRHFRKSRDTLMG